MNKYSTYSFTKLYQLMNENDAEAYYEAALRLEDENGKVRDVAKHYLYYKKSAKLGKVEGMLALATLAVHEHDFEEAFFWWRKSAAKKSSIGLYNCALCYQYGRGVAADTKLMLQYLQQSAFLGHPRALYVLGCEHYKGKLTPQNFFKAAEYFLKAAKSGLINAIDELSKMYAMGQVTGKVDSILAYGLAHVAESLGSKRAHKTKYATVSTHPINETEKREGIKQAKYLVNVK